MAGGEFGHRDPSRQAAWAVDHIYATLGDVGQPEIGEPAGDWPTREARKDDKRRAVADDDTRRVGRWIGRRSHD